MPVSIDNETLEAVRKRWAESPSLPPLPDTGRLATPQPSLYAHLECALQKREAVSNKGVWHDWRKVSILIRGLKADVVSAVAQVKAVFNPTVRLDLPGAAKFIRWWPQESDKLELEQEKKGGEDVWKATIEGVIWSIRTDGIAG